MPFLNFEWVTVHDDGSPRLGVKGGRSPVQADFSEVKRLAADFTARGGDPKAIDAISIDMSPAFISGVSKHLPNALITFDKFHVIAYANTAVDKTRIGQRTDPSLKGLRWKLLHDRANLAADARNDLDALVRLGDHQANGSLLALQGAVAGNSGAQAGQCRARHVAAMSHQRDALEGRADEGGGKNDPLSSGGHRRLDADAPDQRFPRSHQRPVPGRQAQGARLQQLLDHSRRRLSQRRQTRFLKDQPACRLIHSKFNRARKITNLQKLKAEYEKAERAKLAGLKGELESLIDANSVLRQFKSQLLLDLTSEGLRIQIVDEKNRPMFDSASSEVKPYTRTILREIGQTLNKVENHISLAGHTDAQPFASGGREFSNWELSTNRANASRRELVAGGMEDQKIMRVVGMSSTVLFDKQDPYSPINRRISIVIMNKRTEEALLADGKTVDVESAQEIQDDVLGTASATTSASAAPPDHIP